MSETSTAHASPALPDSKWIAGISGDQSFGEVAHRVLDARLGAVWHWLPLAAEKWEADVEYVHLLRTSSRRATAAVRAFAELLPDGAADDLVVLLRRIRAAVAESRDLDVLRLRLPADSDSSPDEHLRRTLERLKLQRQQAQTRIRELHRELTSANLVQTFQGLVSSLANQAGGRANRKFQREAAGCLRPAVKRFLRAAESDLASDADLHELRLRAKKLRYVMEIVAVAFEPAFREKLYPRIGVIQNLLGAIHDHAAGQAIYLGWLVTPSEPNACAFVQSLLAAEMRAHQDLKAAFLAQWTPKSLAELGRQFRAYC